MQPREPADIVLAATVGAIAERADAKIKAYAGPIMPLQEALDPMGLSACQAMHGAIRPKRRKKNRTFRRGLEDGRERVDRRVDVDHIVLAKKAPGINRRLRARYGLK